MESELSNTEIKQYIDKRYKCKKYRGILRDRIIDGKKLDVLVIKYYGEDISPNRMIIYRNKIQKLTNNFAVWLKKEMGEREK